MIQTEALRVGPSTAHAVAYVTLVMIALAGTPIGSGGLLSPGIWAFPWSAVAFVALVVTGAIAATLLLRGRRLGKILLACYYLVQVPVVHVSSFSASAYVGGAAFLTIDEGDVTVGLGLGAEAIARAIDPPLYPPGIGLNVLACGILVSLLLPAATSSTRGQGTTPGS